MADYIKDITYSKKFVGKETVHCDKSTLKSTYSSTLKEKDMECTGDASITCDHSSTIIIDKLTCQNATINVMHSSTIIIKTIEITGTCTINVNHASTLNIKDGSVHTIVGDVKYTSIGICKAAIHTDYVKCAPHSEWETMGGVYLTESEVQKIIRDQLTNEGKTTSDLALHFADELYYCPPINDVKKILRRTTLDLIKWTEEIFDCDDFAFVLKAEFAHDNYRNMERRVPYCFGIVWGEYLPEHHAMNWVITNDETLRLVEPQNDEIREPSANDKGIYMMIV